METLLGTGMRTREQELHASPAFKQGDFTPKKLQTKLWQGWGVGWGVGHRTRERTPGSAALLSKTRLF